MIQSISLALWPKLNCHIDIVDYPVTKQTDGGDSLQSR